MTVQETSIRFTVRLVEDTHVGSGVGRLGIVDAAHIRDADGRLPVIRASTVRGLLREAGEDYLLNLARVDPKNDEIAGQRKLLYRLLGTPVNDTTRDDARGSGLCQIRSWTLDEPSPENCFFLWTSTAREVHSRRPDEATLRTVEMAKSGLKFVGELRFPHAPLTDQEGGPEAAVQLLNKALRRIRAVGSSKTRGWGQVCIDPNTISVSDLPTKPVTTLSEPFEDRGPVGVRLLLRNLEPLGLTTTALAENLLHTLGHLPGGSVRGALLHWLALRDSALAAKLADPSKLQVGNGYPIPGDLARPDALATLQVHPMPLSMRAPKAGMAGQQTQPTPGLPWWAQPAEVGDELGLRDERDAVAVDRQATQSAASNRDPLQGRKRIKTEEYLARSGPGERWRRVRPKLAVRLRNRVPTVRLDAEDRAVLPQKPDGGKTKQDGVGAQDDALFSQQVLLDGQPFVVDLQFDDPRDAANFLKSTASLWQPDNPQQRSWLRLGRGGQPVIVEHWRKRTAHDSTASSQESNDLIVLTLTSDLIARDPCQRFLTSLTPTDLIRLANEADDASGELPPDAEVFTPESAVPGCHDDATGELPPDSEGLVINADRSVCETGEIYGYNSATGLPRAVAVALRRGSVFVVQCDPLNDQTRGRLAALRTKLKLLLARGRPPGERVGEGFGRFCLDLDLHDPEYWTTDRIAEAARRAEKRENRATALLDNWREAVLAEAEAVLAKVTNHQHPLPSLSQWQWLRQAIRQCSKPDREGFQNQVDRVWEQLSTHATRKSGKQWDPWIALLKKVPDSIRGNPEHVRYYFEAITTSAIVHCRQVRK